METLIQEGEFQQQKGNNGRMENQRYPSTDSTVPGEMNNHNNNHGGQLNVANYSRKRPLNIQQECSGHVGQFKGPGGFTQSRHHEGPRRQDLLGRNNGHSHGSRGQGALRHDGGGSGELFSQQQEPLRRVQGRVEHNGRCFNEKRSSNLGPAPPPPPPPPPPSRHEHDAWRNNGSISQGKNGPNRMNPGSFSQQITQQQAVNGTGGNIRRPSWEKNQRNRPTPPPTQAHSNVRSPRQWDRNGADSSDVRRGSVGSSGSDSNVRGVWADRRSRHNIPPPPPAPQLQPSDSPHNHRVLRFQPGPGTVNVDTSGSTNQAVPLGRNGHNNNSHPPPPPRSPRNSPQQRRPGWNVNNHGTRDGESYRRDQGEPEQKRPRLNGPPVRRDPTNLEHCWQPNIDNQRSTEPFQKLTPLPAVKDVNKKRAFAGRFVPKGGTSESFEKLRSEKDRNNKTRESSSLEYSYSPGATTVVTKESEKPTMMIENVEKRSEGKVEEIVMTAAVGDAKPAASTSIANKSETEEAIANSEIKKVVVKLPPSFEVQKHSLRDIVTDSCAPELTEVSTETDLKTSASYSSCSLPHSNVTPSVDVMESPHSLTHPDDDQTLESEANNGGKPAASVIIDVPVEKLSERVEDTELKGIKDIEKTGMSKEIIGAAEVAHDASYEAPPTESSKVDTSSLKEQTPVSTIGVQDVSSDSDSSDDETDEEELQAWAIKMFGIPPPIAVPARPEQALSSSDSSDEDSDEDEERPSRLTIHLKLPPRKISKKPRRRRKSLLAPRKKKGGRKVSATATVVRKITEDEELLDSEEAKRKKEEAKPLTAAEVRKILAEDNGCSAPSSHWVRRSMRQPSRSVLHNPSVRSLVDKLRVNDYDMTVLKMKKYCSDPDTPTMVIDAALDALEENTNCQALYIQVRPLLVRRYLHSTTQS